MRICDICVNYISAVFVCVCKQKASPGVRVGVIDNPSGKPSEDNTVLYRAIWASLLTQKNKAAAEFVQKLLKEQSSQLLQQGTKMKDLLMQVKEGLGNAGLFFGSSEIIRCQTFHLHFFHISNKWKPFRFSKVVCPVFSSIGPQYVKLLFIL